MKKLGLLAIAGLSAVGSLSAAPYYVIKDGELQNGIIEMVYDDLKAGEFDTFDYGQTGPDGEKTAIYKHFTSFKEVRFDLTKATSMPNVKTQWVMGVEYAISAEFAADEDDTWGLFDGKKPLIQIGMFSPTLMDEEKPTIANDKADALVCVDAKFALDGTGDHLAGDTYFTAKKEIFANPNALNEVGVVMVSFARESGTALNGYIKNLWFEECGSERPFYAEDFQGTGAGRYAVYSAASYKNVDATNFASGYALTSDGAIKSGRTWQEDGKDAVFFDSENTLALDVATATAAKATEETPRVILCNDIALPANASKIYTSAMIKWVWSEKAQEAFDAATTAEKAILASLIFNDANNTKVEMFPGDSLNYDWENKKSEIDIPAGATTVSIEFAHGDFEYYVDNLVLSAEANVGNEEAVAEANAEVVVFPNPATDEVYVLNASKIEVVNLTGAVVANANGAKVNVSALPAGLYLVKANVNGNVVVKTVIKK